MKSAARSVVRSIFLGALLPVCSGLAVDWGRELPTDRDDVPGLTVGLLSDVQASVRKTGVAVSKSDLSIGGPGWGLGLSDEYWGWMVSMRSDLLLTSLSESETAQEDIYLKAANKINFNGVDYKYIRIPTGATYKNSFAGAWLDLNGMFHPLTFGDDSESFTPLFEAGFLSVAGTVGIDAGAPSAGDSGYVTGGNSSGFIAMATPQMGGGFEWRLGGKDVVNHVVEFHALVAMPGTSDATHLNIKASYHAYFPLQKYDNMLYTGLDLRYLSTKITNGDEISDFGMNSAMLVFGMTY